MVFLFTKIFMYMNIKKIIKESLDDLQWIRDTEPFTISNKNWIIRNDVEVSVREDRKIQEWIYSQGYEWSNNLTIDEMVDEDTEYYFNVDDHIFDGYASWNNSLSDMVDSYGYELFNWGDIKEQLNLNESEDNDLKWIMDISSSLEDLVLDKAFEFSPVAETYDKDYEKLNDYLIQLGFEPVYGTPSSVNMGEKISGLYAYRDGENKLKFVYSPDLGDENYKEHIIDFAEDHAIGGGSNLSVVDARQFINSI